MFSANHIGEFYATNNNYSSLWRFFLLKEYIGNDKIQFGAISVEYMTNKVFIAYEGTDSLFRGWIENFLLSYRFPTASHKMAIQYLNKHYTFSRKRLILGGHSKGGNLALVA
ncbi:MAG: DUF2974 domain-containing protein, partial [Desulfovibrio sp.]|nr:DUF2974 domain-containing protein [Desulfovibrio sp.]